MVCSSSTMREMSGPRRIKGETLPAPSHELERLKKETETQIPVVRHATPANAHVVPSRRGNAAHAIVPPPPDRDGGECEEVVIEMSGDDEDDDPRPRRSRSETLADPMMTEKLAESARPPAPAPVGPNRHVKRR